MNRPAPADRLLEALRTHFGHDSFRGGQQRVCESVLDGEDALLVMPTGGGKSLCYQLPGLLRKGPTLVISPLIALMDDQVNKLNERGLRAERIHSGLSRQHAREAARRYRDGELDYLVVAPERLKVPGFAKWLNKYPPGLIAIDEAHCISMWGHDFRPEYRLLGERVPIIRRGHEIPLLAMTATATVRVQRDILSRLDIGHARRFIRGFARDDLAIEVVECAQNERVDLLKGLLGDDARRPALVYVLSRKNAEEIAQSLHDSGDMHALPYHAGMSPDRRSDVQTRFLAGDVDVVVATVAFGMGIDKSNIRTVVHVGMPATIEGYYQEIGRAGRDRQGARAVALFNWGDRGLHEFLLDKSYPPVSRLRAVVAEIPSGGLARSDLRPDPDDATALDKLIGAGVVEASVDGWLQRRDGTPNWQEDYQAQRAWRTSQLDDAFGYVGETGCRMAALVRYFGDRRGDSMHCGMCDHCRPDACAVRSFEAPDKDAIELMHTIVDVLGKRQNDSAGRLFREHVGGSAARRKEYDRVLAGLERAGIVRGWMDSFESKGRTISYRRVALERGDWSDDPRWPTTVELDHRRAAQKRKRKRAKSDKQDYDLAGADEDVVDALKTWRLGKARSEQVPAYVVLHNRTLLQIAAAMPTSEAELLAVKGMGPTRVERYGAEILAELSR